MIRTTLGLLLALAVAGRAQGVSMVAPEEARARIGSELRQEARLREVPRLRLAFDAGDPAQATVARYVAPLVAAHFPRLAARKLRLVGFESRDTYFKADVSKEHAFLDSEDRTYDLHVNRRFLEDPPPDEALDAILTHELVHLDGYTRMNTFQLLHLGARYLADGAYRVAYERETDEAALALGKAYGLRLYRLWIYRRLDQEDLAEKRRTYYTPEEIDAWMAARGLFRREAGRPAAASPDAAGLTYR